MNDAATPSDSNSRRVLACLRQAYSALREAVDLQRRPDPAVGAAAWVEKIHELRTVMSAAAQLVRSFDPGQLIETVGWSEQGPPTESGLGGVTPAALLTEAHNDLAYAMDHLTSGRDLPNRCSFFFWRLYVALAIAHGTW